MILGYIIMGGACSRKRDQQIEDILNRGVSGKYSKSSSSKWLATSLSRSGSDVKRNNGECPSLMELCVRKIQEVYCFRLVVTGYEAVILACLSAN